jgi:hypothetical protein
MPVTYRLTVETGTAEFAGTDADVYVTLYGTEGNSGERLLDNALNNFENGMTDIFSIEMRELGDIKRVRIRHDNTGIAPGWLLSKIVVHNEESDKEWTFPCDRWLAHDEDDGEVDRVLDPA